MIKIAIVVLDGVFDSALSVSLDVLNTAKIINRDLSEAPILVDVQTYSSQKKPMKTGCGLALTADMSIDELDYADYVIVPGLGINQPEMLESVLTSRSGANAISSLKRLYAAGATLTASCSATFLLAEAGIFDQQVTTTSWWLSAMFRSKYPNVCLETDRLLVTGERYICAGAAMAQTDLIMTVVAHIYGKQTAKLTASYLLIDQRQLQSQYIHSGLAIHHHPVVANAERWIRKNIGNEFSIKELADAMNVSKRTLARHTDQALGISPHRYVQRIRLEHAIHLLETSTSSFETISNDVGYRDSSSLRRLLKKTMGKTPTHFRNHKK